ncbi:hypothetical protein LSAT2_029964 [Lamellibrachia satsuma]|nr:hypothetical protein LSAT2_029964 [Lamellibrachia satsuma]
MTCSTYVVQNNTGTRPNCSVRTSVLDYLHYDDLCTPGAETVDKEGLDVAGQQDRIEMRRVEGMLVSGLYRHSLFVRRIATSTICPIPGRRDQRPARCQSAPDTPRW